MYSLILSIKILDVWLFNCMRHFRCQTGILSREKGWKWHAYDSLQVLPQKAVMRQKWILFGPSPTSATLSTTLRNYNNWINIWGSLQKLMVQLENSIDCYLWHPQSMVWDEKKIASLECPIHFNPLIKTFTCGSHSILLQFNTPTLQNSSLGELA